MTFSTTIALATVLIELILCEISNTIDSAFRALALRCVDFDHLIVDTLTVIYLAES